jgi:hypothetical protein
MNDFMEKRLKITLFCKQAKIKRIKLKRLMKMNLKNCMLKGNFENLME